MRTFRSGGHGGLFIAAAALAVSAVRCGGSSPVTCQMVFCPQPDATTRLQECTDGNGNGTYKARTLSCSFQYSNDAQRLACLDQITSYHCYPGDGGTTGGGGAGGAR